MGRANGLHKFIMSFNACWLNQLFEFIYFPSSVLAVSIISMSDRSKAAVTKALADPNVSVASLEQVIDRTLDYVGVRNLDTYIDKAGDQNQWRKVCQAKGMASMGFMVDELVDVCRNGVVPSKKLEAAIIARNTFKKLNWTDTGIQEYANVRGGWL